MRGQCNIIKLIMIFLAIGSLVVFSSTSVLCADELGRDLGPVWGTADFVSYSKHNSDFTGINNVYDDSIKDWGEGIKYCSSYCHLATGLQLPQGARIIGWRLDAFDGNDTASVSLALQTCPYDSCFCPYIASPISTSGSGGFQSVTQSCSLHQDFLDLTTSKYDICILTGLVMTAILARNL